jgi:ElaB/YqjD/DUF883 family membrane-anchored ribosome-binding protein
MELMNHTKKNGTINLKEKYDHFVQELQEALFENKKAIEKLKKATEEAFEESGEKLSHAAKGVQKNVKKNPWAYIGGATAIALFVGFILGKKK